MKTQSGPLYCARVTGATSHRFGFMFSIMDTLCLWKRGCNTMPQWTSRGHLPGPDATLSTPWARARQWNSLDYCVLVDSEPRSRDRCRSQPWFSRRPNPAVLGSGPSFGLHLRYLDSTRGEGSCSGSSVSSRVQAMGASVSRTVSQPAAKAAAYTAVSTLYEITLKPTARHAAICSASDG